MNSAVHSLGESLMYARISEYWRRVFGECFHAAMHWSGFPTTGRVPLGAHGLLALRA
ncbi:hypothetical protein LGM38_14920 [Burkholderia vietnamiensis]|uniref:hypothetical protein n=1 Tax=Burkholderia vietnamiensis TaxID=60552 RepID=UPI001CF0E963|nr:hypothetical protein [Burkholderia vietnamiensis]MCA8013342.1 hypothetical protein [Burkholderia vietnamiensis]